MANLKHMGNGRFAPRTAVKGSHMTKVKLVFSAIALVGISGAVMSHFDSVKPAETVVREVKKVVVKEVRAESKAEKFDRILREDKESLQKLEKEIVGKIRALERGGLESTKDNVFITFDPADSERKMCQKSGGIMDPICLSVGELQMKRPFIIEMNRKLTGEIMTDREAFMLALDTEKAEKFAVEVIIEVKGSCNSWTTCKNNKDWFQPKIDEARRLRGEIKRFETI